MAKISWKPQKLKRIAKKRSEKVLREIGKETVDDIKASFVQGVSQPGQPPGVDTGLLKRSIKFEVTGSPLELTVGVEEGVPYALALEFGYGPRNLQPRPYLRRGLRKATRRTNRKLDKDLKNV